VKLLGDAVVFRFLGSMLVLFCWDPEAPA